MTQPESQPLCSLPQDGRALELRLLLKPSVRPRPKSLHSPSRGIWVLKRLRKTRISWCWRCDVRHTKEGVPRATHIFEAAIWHYAVQPVCRCGHSAKFDAGLLWFRFHRKCWDDNLRAACRHFWCRLCAWNTGRRVQPLRLEVVAWEKGVIQVKELVDEREWKRAISRYRC